MVVRIENKAYKKIEAYALAEKENGEIGGLLLGKIDDFSNIIIKDAILLKQLKTNVNFEIDEEAMMDFTKNASAKKLKSVMGWWHSHHNMGTFWSLPDTNCFERMCNLSNFCFGIVVAFDKKGIMNSRSRLMVKDKQGRMLDIDDIQPNIEIRKFDVNFVKIKNEVKDLVNIDTRTWVVCPMCHGQGELLESDVKLTKDDCMDYLYIR